MNYIIIKVNKRYNILVLQFENIPLSYRGLRLKENTYLHMYSLRKAMTSFTHCIINRLLLHVTMSIHMHLLKDIFEIVDNFLLQSRIQFSFK